MNKERSYRYTQHPVGQAARRRDPGSPSSIVYPAALPLRAKSLKSRDDFRKTRSKALAHSGLQENAFLIPENETTKPIPLRLVHPFFANGKAFHSPSLHRGNGRTREFVERAFSGSHANAIYFLLA